MITRYRTGSHNLAIETGRFRTPPVPRNERLCMCEEGIQTVNHVLLNCHLLNNVRDHTFDNVEKCLEWSGINKFLLHTSKILKVEC